MGHGHKYPPELKKFRRLMYISPIITLMSLILLLWSYRTKPPSVVGFQRHHKPLLPRSSETPQVQGPRTPGQVTLLQQCHPEKMAPRGKKVSLVVVSGTKTLLLSAYREHRNKNRGVRVIAVVLRSQAVAYRCHLCCQERLHVSEGVSRVHSDHFQFAYGTADIMCPLPSGCETVSHVAVTSDATKSEDDPDAEFMEVQNQRVPEDTRSGPFPYNFAVCISTMFDFTNVLQLVQSLEMLQLLGVNRVVIYKTSCSPETQRVLDYYTHKGLVEVIPWYLSSFVSVSRGWLPEHGPGDLHYHGQIPALNDCLYRYMYRSRYVALQDMDELILPQSVDSWSEMLPLLEEKYGADQCYMFENNVFPNTVALPPLASQPPSWPNVSGVNILAHLYQEPVRSETQYSNFKIIVNPRVVYTLTVHGLLDPEGGCSWVDRDEARMYHTRAPKQPELTPDQLVYDGRLLSYCDHLTPAVNAVLMESGILPQAGTQ